jgi:hypothetical protein
MSEMDFVKLGFTLKGDGELRAPSNSRVTLVRKNDLYYEIKIALRTGNAVIAKVVLAKDLMITREGKAV